MPSVAKACKSGDTFEIYSALMVNMAQKLDETESGRDYAAIAKSLILVIEKYEDKQTKRAETKKKVSSVRAAQKKFRVA